MKKNFKNTIIFNYQYLDTLSEYLNKEAVDQESKIALLRRLLNALVATEKGEQHEHYRHLKKNLTEHKALELIIELLVKKDYPALQTIPFDYSKGIFELFRLQKGVISDAVIAVLNHELAAFVMSGSRTMESLKTEDHFDFYNVILNNLLEIRQLEIHQLEPLISQSCEHALSQICRLCDQLKEAFYSKSITDSQYALRIAYMLDHYQALLADSWGNLRLGFLRVAVRRQTIELLKAQKATESIDIPAHKHGSSCECQEHKE